MNITSLLITLAGIIIIIALYLMSRIAQNKLPKKHQSNIPDLKNKDGSHFTSILDDIPATDGSTPKTLPVQIQSRDKAVTKNQTNTTKEEISPQTIESADPQQHILFISAKSGAGLDGNSVQKTLMDNGLSLGDMNIYHYLTDVPGQTDKSSLFRVANGVDPWTLKEEDLRNKKLAGLSVVMLTPTKINNIKAMEIFIKVAKRLALDLDGVIKNQQQQELSLSDEKNMIKSIN